jgi:hypothetical protein
MYAVLYRGNICVHLQWHADTPEDPLLGGSVIRIYVKRITALFEELVERGIVTQDSLKINTNHPYKKIRFNIIHITNQSDVKELTKRTHPLVNDLAAPIKTILGSYASQTDFINFRLEKYLSEIYGNKKYYHSINLYKKGEADTYPMNWSISSQSLKSINRRLENNEGIPALVQTILAPN